MQNSLIEQGVELTDEHFLSDTKALANMKVLSSKHTRRAFTLFKGVIINVTIVCGACSYSRRFGPSRMKTQLDPGELEGKNLWLDGGGEREPGHEERTRG